jgi:hypothetical protein
MANIMWPSPPSRDWCTETGLRQIALDILIHHLAENVTSDMLTCKDSAVAAWLPHLHYVPILTSILWVNGEESEVPITLSAGGQNEPLTATCDCVRPRYGSRTPQRAQVQLWLDDWMHQTHTTFLKQREPTAPHNYRYAEWEQFIREGVATADLDAHGLKMAWRFRL